MIEDSMLGSEPPQFDADTALRVAGSEYGLSGTASPLESERDQNFRLRSAHGTQYVLKISNLKEDLSVIDFQTRAFEQITRCAPELRVPRNIPTLQGSETCAIGDTQGRMYLVRLISWLDGIPVKEVTATPELLRSMGWHLAHLGVALKDFSHPATACRSLWDLNNAQDLIRYLSSIRDPALYRLLDGIFERYLDSSLPVLQKARSQVVHGDLNAENVLADAQDQSRVAGIIDFGDMVHTALVNDVAVAAAYQIAPQGDPLADCLEFIGAYHEVTPLEDVEAEILLNLMQTRLACSLVIWSWRAEQFSEPPVFLQRALDFGRSRLEHLADMDVEKQRNRIIVACETANPA